MMDIITVILTVSMLTQNMIPVY